MNSNKEESKKLLDIIIDGIQDKKGENVVSISFDKLRNSVSSYFVICTGNSSTHVNALADSVEENTSKRANQKAWRKEGINNAQWVILDYVDVVVHIFQHPTREYYGLEDLWGDCPIQQYR